MLVLGILIIPSINLEADIVPTPVVNHMHDMTVVGYNQVGHLEGTGWVDNDYRIVLAAHNYLEFKDLYKVNTGDVIYLIANGNINTYKVTDIQVVPADDVSWLTALPKNTIVLQTCVTNDLRLMVYGELQ